MRDSWLKDTGSPGFQEPLFSISALSAASMGLMDEVKAGTLFVAAVREAARTVDEAVVEAVVEVDAFAPGTEVVVVVALLGLVVEVSEATVAPVFFADLAVALV